MKWVVELSKQETRDLWMSCWRRLPKLVEPDGSCVPLQTRAARLPMVRAKVKVRRLLYVMVTDVALTVRLVK